MFGKQPNPVSGLTLVILMSSGSIKNKLNGISQVQIMRIRTFQISIRRPAGRTHRPVDRPTSTVSIFQIHPDDLLRFKTCRKFQKITSD